MSKGLFISVICKSTSSLFALSAVSLFLTASVLVAWMLGYFSSPEFRHMRDVQKAISHWGKVDQRYDEHFVNDLLLSIRNDVRSLRVVDTDIDAISLRIRDEPKLLRQISYCYRMSIPQSELVLTNSPLLGMRDEWFARHDLSRIEMAYYLWIFWAMIDDHSSASTLSNANVAERWNEVRIYLRNCGPYIYFDECRDCFRFDSESLVKAVPYSVEMQDWKQPKGGMPVPSIYIREKSGENKGGQ